jgi:PAS domain S-box-containing protein
MVNRSIMMGNLVDYMPLDFTCIENQSMVSNLLDNLPGMVYRCMNEPEWTMEFISEGCLELTGYTPFELIRNQTISYGHIIFPDDRSTVWMQVQSALLQKKPFELVYRIVTRDHQEKWVRENGRGIFDSEGNLYVLEGYITDITEEIKAESKIQHQVQQFQALRNIDMAISASFDLRLVLNILLEQITSQLNVDAAALLLSKPEAGTIEYAAGRGFRTNALRHTHLLFGEGYAGRAVFTRQVIHIPDLTETPGQLRQSKQLADEGFITYLGIPLIAKGQVKGVLEVFHRTKKEVDPDWMRFLETLSGQAAIAIDNATLFEDLQRSNTELMLAYDATLEGWAKALELRDRQTEGHTQRVIDMTLRLAKMVGIQDEHMQHIRRGALLHDIGKMGIPDSILLKPESLTPNEWEVMRQHPVMAYELLSPINYLRPALNIPYCHHEKWDGTGYPRGLKGEEIPLPARIFAVTDVWDALTSERPYRPAWTAQDAFAYIAEQAGRYFDPSVIEAFFMLVQEQSLDEIT